MMNQIDDLERVVQDLKQQSNLKCLQLVNHKDYEENYAMKLANSQEEYSDLKITCTRMETNAILLECLAKDPKDWPKAEEVEDHIKSLKAERKQDKMAIEDLENGIETLAEELQTKNKELKETLSSLETKLDKVKAKKKDYEELKAKSEEIITRKGEKEKCTGEVKDLEEKTLQASFAIQQCNTAIASLEHCIKMLTSDLELFQNHVGEIKEDLLMDEKHQRNKNDEILEKMHWLEGAIGLHRNLSGLSIKEINDDSLVLEIHNTKPLSDSTQQLSNSLLLTLKFTLRATKPRLCGAEVNIESLHIEDLVKKSVETGNVVEFIGAVQKLYQDYHSLREEIDELQKNYAVDWEPSCGRLRAMLGKSGKTVCTLGIDSSYPAADSLSLLEVESKDQDINKDGLEPPSCNSLSEWVKYLQEVFSS